MYEITDWMRYEVNKKGHEAGEGDELRAGPLRFVRLKVHGHSQSNGYRKLLMLAGDKAMEVFGIFCKLLEIAGDSGNAGKFRRGILTAEREGEPATAEDLAFLLGVPVEIMENALKVLCSKELGWVTETDSQICREIPDLPEPFINTSPNPNQHKSIQDNTSGPEKRAPEKPQEKPKTSFPNSFQDLDLDLKNPAKPSLVHFGIENILGPYKTASTKTTMKNVAACIAQYGDKGLEVAKQMAREAVGKDKPTAYFIAGCKTVFKFKKTVNWNNRGAAK